MDQNISINFFLLFLPVNYYCYLLIRSSFVLWVIRFIWNKVSALVSCNSYSELLQDWFHFLTSCWLYWTVSWFISQYKRKGVTSFGSFPCLLFSGRVVIFFPHNSKCLSVVKRTKPFCFCFHIREKSRQMFMNLA